MYKERILLANTHFTQILTLETETNLTPKYNTYATRNNIDLNRTLQTIKTSTPKSCLHAFKRLNPQEKEHNHN